MDDKLAQELYSESLQLSNIQLGHSSTANDSSEADIQADDGSLWGSSDEELDKTSDLDREWQRRHDQFHAIGYRDGLIAGKEASAQEGFNIGFKQSVPVGYNRGITRDALKLFHDDMLTKKAAEQSKPTEVSGSVGGAQEQSSNSSGLGTYTAKLQSLILDSPEIQVQFFHQEVSGTALC
ncbi:Detected protein of confused Function [Hibiscus syriacus]|uniref:Detected protein of confused Function n=1 Tax=Hibiscus syriacus TaxID=106335 RepID=A0A6A3ANB9_HIBSY|nr:Detected protein of confused Function [Hibiscus syriacus]